MLQMIRQSPSELGRCRTWHERWMSSLLCYPPHQLHQPTSHGSFLANKGSWVGPCFRWIYDIYYVPYPSWFGFSMCIVTIYFATIEAQPEENPSHIGLLAGDATSTLYVLAAALTDGGLFPPDLGPQQGNTGFSADGDRWPSMKTHELLCCLLFLLQFHSWSSWRSLHHSCPPCVL